MAADTKFESPRYIDTNRVNGVIGSSEVSDKALDAAHRDSQPAPTLPPEIAADVAAVYASLQRAIDVTLRTPLALMGTTVRVCVRDAIDDLQRLERLFAEYLRTKDILAKLDAEDQPSLLAASKPCG